ncbi:MAG: hypothetical protein KGJ13_07875 [Patescibacteria group bacterium]|nr:hypothetical protein [Patescibacteria group bacterium]
MTDAQLKNIFSRFQNLNLLFLIRDLELGLVAVGNYRDRLREASILCPVAHGCDTYLGNAGANSVHACQIFQLPEEVLSEFLDWWDNQGNKRRWNRLLTVLRSIRHERTADADAVQRVTAPRPINENKFARVLQRV